MPVKPTFKEAFLFWLKLGFISFGGPAGQLAIMHEFLVEKKKWISDSRFLHALNYCMFLPGPEAQQLATYIGWLLHGIRGGLAAGLLFIFPSIFILLTLSILYVTFGNIPWVYALFNGLKPAVVAIILAALIRIGKKSLYSWLHYLLAFLSFAALFIFNIPFPYIILAALAAGFLLRKQETKRIAVSGENNLSAEKEEENQYFINAFSQAIGTEFKLKKVIFSAAASIALWLFPFLLFYYFSTDFSFWAQLNLFFTKAAFITFGGAYAVLPYVAQVAVEKLHWLSKLEMLDGLALGETTPGPLIMVLAFVGFMAGFNHFGGSLIWGTAGLLATTFYTFLPCFLFIFAGAPFIERTRENPHLKAVLGFVTAAVVGVMLNLAIYLGKAVIFPEGVVLEKVEWFSLIWIVISALALHKFKINMMLWIVVSAVAGLIYFFIRT